MNLLGKLLAVLFCFLPSVTSAEYFKITKYSVDITVKKDSVLEIREELHVNFTEKRHGIFRKIPYKYQLSGSTAEMAERPFTLGKDYSYDIYDIEVPGETKKVYKEGRYLIIRIGDPDKYVSGYKVYRISYKVYGGINFFSNHAELYWNIIGTEWDVPIENVEAFIFFPTELDITENELFVFTGAYGARENKAYYSFDGRVLNIKSTAPLSPREGISVGVKLPPNYLEKGSLFLNTWLFMINNAVFLIPVVVFAVFFIIWWLWGRDENYVKMVYFKPPHNVTPAEAGVVIDDIVDNKDLISLIFYWAANGYLEIEEVEDSLALIFKKRDYILTKIKDLSEDARPYEHTIFNGLFPIYGVNSCRISTLKNQFYETMSKARAELDRQIEELKLYTTSRTYAKLFSGLAIIVGFAGFITGVSLKRLDFFLSLALTAFIIFIFARIMPKKTSEGMKVFKILDGFKTFVEKVEKSRLNMLLKEDPAYFDKTLPYAISLGVADKWAEKFNDLLKEPPQWYKGYHYERFSTIAFVKSVNAGISDMNTAFTSAPSSAGSGGSGFSGGGFSGGGGGGGGGGSW